MLSSGRKRKRQSKSSDRKTTNHSGCLLRIARTVAKWSYKTCSKGWARTLVWYSTKLESPSSRQNPLQRAAMHLETPRSFRHVVSARFVNLQYVLPAHLSRRHRTRWRFSSHAFRREQDRNNIVHVRRFGEIVHGTEFDCPDCSGDISVAGKDDGVASGCRSLSAEITSNPHPSPNLALNTDSAFITSKPLASIARVRQCINRLSSSTINTDLV
jgi:hypothetical protein